MARLNLSIVCSLNESKESKGAVVKKFASLCHMLKPLGYDGIELSLLEPEKIETMEIVELCESYELKIPALGTGGTYIRFGYSFGDLRESIRNAAIERIVKYIEFAENFDAKVIIGLIRGRYNHESNSTRERINIISCLKECCQVAENHNIELVFEPINRFEIDSFNTISQSKALLHEIGSDHLRLLIDSFHTNLEEDPVYIWDDLIDIVPFVGHIHLADCTRRAPGTGHFDFKTFLNGFKKGGYEGFVSLETIMKPSFEELAKDASEYLDLIL
jgi:5-keto-L-gluconate epimerase